jgi:lipid-A-disaccharide synthase
VELPASSIIDIACVAGEPSGDMLAAGVIAELSQRYPNSCMHGIGGPKMAASGFDVEWPMEKLAVRGYVEALKQLPQILGIRRELIRSLDKQPPNIFLGIDAPDFNLGVEKHLKSRGVKTAHFISPSIWAWRKERIRKIEEAVEHLFCIFPFEPELYRNTKVKAHYVGHPLASSIPLVPNPEAAKSSLGIKNGAPVIAVLPGSRASEIDLVGPGFIQAIAHMAREYQGDLNVLIPVAMPSLRGPLEQLLNRYLSDSANVFIQLLDGQSSLVLEAADVVLIASGTATLEAALWKKPMVISYTVPALTAWIMRRQGYLPYIGLPNILAGEFLVPEILQEEAQPANLAAAVLSWLDDPARVSQLKERFTLMHEQLQRPTNSIVADLIGDIIESR